MTWNDWLNLLLRWAHLVAGIAWIGSSFYFMWLDQALRHPEPPRPAVEGEVWMVHSGGFYRVERRRIGPGEMPATLHWFKWEAAFTWITGALLLTVVYYLSGGLTLLDPRVSSISPLAATALGIGVIVVGWLIYDALWESPLARRPGVATAVSLALAAVAIGLFTRFLSGRAAYVHTGALFGTIMVANVWVRILPGQQRMIDATARGETPDLSFGVRAKHRSVHNSYMTLPVLFMMLSNHFPAIYGGTHNAVALVLMIVAGVAARHVMIGEGSSRVWALAPVAASLIAVAWLSPPASALRARALPTPDNAPAPSFAQVQAIVLARCVACHSATPRIASFGVAPAGVSFDDPANIRRLAPRIYVRAVATRTMPLANMTGITESERTTLGRWIEHGAPEH